MKNERFLQRPGVARRSIALALALALPAAWLLAAPARAAAPLRVPDTIAQRVQACTPCHGKEGRATPDGYYPRIAGKPDGYLHNQLLNFREGRRVYGPMNHLVSTLSDDYLKEIASHFAALDLPYPPPERPAVTAATLERGRALVMEGRPAKEVPACVRCHGQRLTGVAPAIPGLLGLSRDYLNAQFGAWRNGQRHAQAPDCMGTVARRLEPEDIGAVAAWLATQPVPADAKPDAAPRAPLPLRCGGVPEGQQPR